MCLRHGKKCQRLPRPGSDSTLSVLAAGSPCPDWSPFGKRGGKGGATAPVFMTLKLYSKAADFVGYSPRSGTLPQHPESDYKLRYDTHCVKDEVRSSGSSTSLLARERAKFPAGCYRDLRRWDCVFAQPARGCDKTLSGHEYTVTGVGMDPQQFGFPIARRRQYCLCVRKDTQLLGRELALALNFAGGC